MIAPPVCRGSHSDSLWEWHNKEEVSQFMVVDEDEDDLDIEL